MLVEVKVPQLSESVAEATLAAWHKKAGEFVKRDENLVDIETDKVVLETPAPDSGVLVKIVKGDGSTVAVVALLTNPRARPRIPCKVALVAVHHHGRLLLCRLLDHIRPRHNNSNKLSMDVASYCS